MSSSVGMIRSPIYGEKWPANHHPEILFAYSYSARLKARKPVVHVRKELGIALLQPSLVSPEIQGLQKVVGGALLGESVYSSFFCSLKT